VQVIITHAAFEMMEHLVSTGRERIAYASDQMFQRTGDVRFRAYCDVVSSAGLPLEFIDLPSGERATARVAIREYVAAQGCPGVIYCHNDDIAIAAYRALSDLGLEVPKDCALAGCDGIPDTEYLPMPMTTIIQPFTAIAQSACDFLKNRLDNPETPAQRTELHAKLAVRASSLL
jgi:LacI family transcriptional regulator